MIKHKREGRVQLGKYYDPETGKLREFEVTKELLDKVEHMSGIGLTFKQLAAFHGMSANTFRLKCIKYPELYNAVKQGRAKRIGHVAGKLMTKIDDGDTIAMMFYLKTRAGWRELKSDDPENTEDEISELENMDDKEQIKINTDDPIEAAKAYSEIMLGDK